jgi:hypothetical protein
MCLHGARKIRNDRKKNIICWKVERYVGVWVSPHRGHILPEGRSDIPKLEKLEMDSWNSLGGGAFHSFKTLRDAKRQVDDFLKTMWCRTYRVIRCEIPPDCLAFRGMCGTGYYKDGYASRSIIKGKEVYRTGKEEI